MVLTVLITAPGPFGRADGAAGAVAADGRALAARGRRRSRRRAAEDLRGLGRGRVARRATPTLALSGAAEAPVSRARSCGMHGRALGATVRRVSANVIARRST